MHSRPTEPAPSFSPLPPASLSPPAEWALLLGIAVAAVLPTFLGRGLWRGDEMRWAEVARELLHRPNWFVLRLLGEYYPDKPPLYFWVSALLMKAAGGANPVTPRLISVLSTVGVAILVRGLGNRLYGRPVGLGAAVLWMGSLYPAVLATSVAIDPFYSLLITGALAGAGIAVADRRWGRGAALVFCVCTAAAMYTKGPIGLLLPLATVGVAMGVGVPFPRGTGRVVLWSVIAALGITAIWLVMAAREVGLEVILGQVGLHGFGYATNSWSHPEPAWFFLGTFWRDFFPVSLFVPAGVAAVALRRPVLANAVAARRGVGARLRAAAKAQPIDYYLVVWFATIVVLHSVFSGKRSPYILPALPAGVLLVARAYLRGAERDGSGGSPAAYKVFRWLDGIGQWILVLCLVGTGLAAWAHPLYYGSFVRHLTRTLSAQPTLQVGPLSPGQQVTLWVAGVLLLGLAALLIARRGNPVPLGKQIVVSCCVTGLIAISVMGAVGGPLLYPMFSGRSLIKAAEPFVRDPGIRFYFRTSQAAWLLAWTFRTSERLEVIDGTPKFKRTVLRSKPPIVVVLEADRYEETYRETLSDQFKVLGSGVMGTKDFLILGRGVKHPAGRETPEVEGGVR